MNVEDVSRAVVDEAVGAATGESGTEPGSSAAARYARRAVKSGALAGVAGGLLLLRGGRTVRRGARLRGLLLMATGAALLALARRQRGGGVDQTDVVDTAPNIEEVADDPDAGTEHAGGDEAEAVVDTGPDVEEVESAGDAGGGASDRSTEADDVDQTDVADTGVDEEEARAAVREVDDEEE